jgi:penicillin-binding protein 1A
MATSKKNKAARKPAKGQTRVKTKNRVSFKRVMRLITLTAIWGAILSGAVIAFLYVTLPPLDQATQLKRGPTSTLLDREGAFFASYGEFRGDAVTIANLPPHLPRAVIAIEDRRFYDHMGIDLRGIARAIFVNITTGSFRQGASTLTQQLARNLLLSHERSFVRKAREALLALKLERRFSKDEILTIYLNRVYFGGGAYGVDAAARRFFGKPATELNLWESALLAGSLKAPSRLAPDRNPEGAATRARLVVKAMVDAGYLSAKTTSQSLAILASAATARGTPASGNARYFSDWALDQADGFTGGLIGDAIVQTTLDTKLQTFAEQAVANGLGSRPKHIPPEHWPSQAALVAITNDGAVRAMVGGRQYSASQFNRAVQAERQMGSIFKAFVYIAAMEAGMEPDDDVLDAPITVGKWQPRAYNDRYYGNVTLREALARSLNAPAVRIAERIGRDKAITVARRLGISSTLTPTPSVTLGAGTSSLLEVTGAFAAVAAGGKFIPPYGVTHIRSRSGATLYEPSMQSTRVLSPEVIERVNNMMSAVVSWGSGKGAKIDRDAAGKTGTSQRNRDGWFIGYTTDLTVGVWVGHDADQAVPGLTGGGLPAKIWRDFMMKTRSIFVAKPLPGISAYTARSEPNFAERTITKFSKWVTPKPNIVYEYPDQKGSN